MMKENNQLKWERGGRSLFENFAADLGRYTEIGTSPEAGDNDISFGLELQEKRLKNRGLSMEYAFVPRGYFAKESGPGKTWTDNRYVSRMEYRSCEMTRKFMRNGKKEYSDKEDIIFYQTITDVHNQELVADDLYSCPSCGGITKLGNLNKGCQYCGGRFKISDIFPKITNYYFVEDAGTREEAKSDIKKYAVACGVIGLVANTLYHYFGNAEGSGEFLKSFLNWGIIGLLGGALLGAFLYNILFIIKAVVNAGKSVPMLSSIGSSSRFVMQMKKYSPYFSYEYFSNKVVSMLKMILYADKPENLAIYVGNPMGDIFNNVVDVFYAGAVGLKSFQVAGDECVVAANVFLDVLYDKDGHFTKKREKYVVYVKKNISKPINMGFSISHLECKNCGKSFDATKQKYCPACQAVYKVDEDDWVITKIEK